MLKIFASLMFCSVLATAETEKPSTPIQLSLNPKHQLAEQAFGINFLRLGLGAYNRRCHGLDIGLVSGNYGKEWSNALQLTLISMNSYQRGITVNLFGLSKQSNGINLSLCSNISSEGIAGINIAPLGIISEGDIKGINLSLLNGTKQNLRGINVGLLTNFAYEDLSGLNLSLLSNRSKAETHGFNLSAIYNSHNGGWGASTALIDFGKGDFKGIQLAALARSTELTGLQAGAFSCSDSVTGIQAGLINNVGKINGIQLGLINICQEEMHGIQLGILNLIFDDHPLTVMPMLNARF